MADVQLENGYVKLANGLLDAFLRLRLTSYQTSVFFSIVRKTYGFNKREDQISLSQFEKYTGITRSHVHRTLSELEEMNLITVDKKSHMKVIYGVQKDYDKWLTVTKPGNSLKPQLLPNQDATVTKPGYKTVTKPGNNKRHKRQYTKNNIVQKLSSKETLEAFLLSLPEYQNIPSHLKEPVILFVNKIRQGNKTRMLAPSRVKGIILSFKQIIDKYGAGNTIAGINAVFAKEKKTSFTYSGQNPTGYARQVAKSLDTKAAQKQAEQKVKQEREAMKQAPGTGALLDEIDKVLH